MAHLVSSIVRNIGGGIGLASEAYKHHKANKSQNQDNGMIQTQGSPWSHGDAVSDHDDEETLSDKAQDDHGQETSNDPEDLADELLSRHPPTIDTLPRPSETLPYPIIIPQRRPTDRSRGMIKAYPEILAQRGISQETFLDFIETFNHSIQASKWIATINLASIATVWLPTVTSLLVSMAITAATTAAMEVQGRYKTNRFLEKINKEFFMPRGLFCLVLTWNPEDDDARTTVNLESMAADVLDVKKARFMPHLRSSDGKTYGEFQWPETAPLIYPDMDTPPKKTEAAEKPSFKKRVFVQDYMDRRAQAKFAMQHPGSALAQGPKPQFSSRFADPAHPANSGSLVALLSGGAVQMPDLMQMRGSLIGLGDRDPRSGDLHAAQLGARIRDRRVDHIGGGFDRNPSVANNGPLGLAQKIMKKNVLYLLIVDMPSETELAEARVDGLDHVMATATAAEV